jgi:hypothetical protein
MILIFHDRATFIEKVQQVTVHSGSVKRPIKKQKCKEAQHTSDSAPSWSRVVVCDLGALLFYLIVHSHTGDPPTPVELGSTRTASARGS